MPSNWTEENIQEIKKQIRGCFGSADLQFTSHPLDEERATKLLDYAFLHNIPLIEVETIAYDYLSDQGATIAHITKEMSEVRDFFMQKLT